MRNINVLSGLICVGKSNYLHKLMSRQEFANAISVSLDDVGLRYWGRRVMTKTEKVYRNQLAREEIQRRIIVDGVENILLEMVLLTRLNHQEPFVQMVKQTKQYLYEIEPERAILEGARLPLDYGMVNFNVVLFYCSLDRVRDRIERRNLQKDSNSPGFTMEGVFDTAVQFEMPTSYEPLLIDTTDESSEAEKARMDEMLAFFLRGDKPPESIIHARMEEARDFLDELNREAQKAGIYSGAAFLRSDYQKK